MLFSRKKSSENGSGTNDYCTVLVRVVTVIHAFANNHPFVNKLN